MDFLTKLKAEAKAGWEAIYAKYQAIQSPIARLGIIVLVAVVLLLLVVKLLPLLIMLAVIGAIGFGVYCVGRAILNEDKL